MAAHRLCYQDREISVTVERAGEDFVVTVDGRELRVVRNRNGSMSSADSNGSAASDKSRVFVTIDSRLLEFELAGTDSVTSGGDSGHAGEKDKLRAPMPGKIVKILVETGEAVKAKQPLAVIESMKMENQLLSPSVGLVKTIHFAAGDQVDADEVIVELDISE